MDLSEEDELMPEGTLTIDGRLLDPEDQKLLKVEISWSEVYSLVGRLLNYVDATFTDVEQRKAQKRLVKNTCYDWIRDLYEEQYPENKELHI